VAACQTSPLQIALMFVDDMSTAGRDVHGTQVGQRISS